MIKSYSIKSLYYSGFGITFQTAGFAITSNLGGGEIFYVTLPMIAGGGLLLTIGLCYFAKAKGRSIYWGLLGIMSWIGLLASLLLKDQTIFIIPKFCQNCGYSLKGLQGHSGSCPECGSDFSSCV